MKRLSAVFMLTCLVVSAGLADDKKAGYIEYTEYKLDNGLRVILSPDHTAPTSPRHRPLTRSARRCSSGRATGSTGCCPTTRSA